MRPSENTTPPIASSPCDDASHLAGHPLNQSGAVAHKVRLCGLFSESPSF